MMHMTFYWSRQVTLLVDSWRTDSWTSYAVSLLACFLAALFYQYLEDFRIRLKLLAAAKPSAAQEPLLAKPAGKLKAAKLGGAAFFGINSGIGYMLMLAVMSFNGGVFLAIIAGLSAGYLLFRSGDEEVTAIVDNPCACA